LKVSQKCIKAIQHHEGIRFNPYQCPARLWTIGCGHVMFPEQGKLKIDQRDAFVPPPQNMRKHSMEEVNAILKADLARFEKGVATYCPVPLTQGQFDALVSFSFNVGLGTLQRSTMRQKVLRGDMDGAAEELLKYCMAGGKILKGLQKRRIDERAVFLS
jgi:lysozyme